MRAGTTYRLRWMGRESGPFSREQLDEMLARIERFRPEQPTEAPEVPLEAGPGFKTPGTGTGFNAAGAATGFKAPGAGTGFKRPDTGTGSRFKRLK